MKVMGGLIALLWGVLGWYACQPVPEELAYGRAALASAYTDPVYQAMWEWEQANAEAYALAVRLPVYR
ncbi:hypothetical protein J31TS4_16270 [Paenibacillus sp. J31TS4]|uniref:hypothetical protein n=1 Tax=Paenibacillus sp. J31TS4 TaxID=2807195 RepID=UPI001B13B077|nr:hypothetical protein [Paenibacillus sp. J31TS4]GIP38347.1 hypothetical protein J31TS4_16270 [Paenibacillus sp. J31TS4]